MFMFMHVVDSSYVLTSLKKSFPSFVCHENVIDDGGDDDYVQVRVANNFFVFFFADFPFQRAFFIRLLLLLLIRIRVSALWTPHTDTHISVAIKLTRDMNMNMNMCFIKQNYGKNSV